MNQYSHQQTQEDSQTPICIDTTFSKITAIMSFHEQMVFRTQQERSVQLYHLLQRLYKQMSLQTPFLYSAWDYELILEAFTTENGQKAWQHISEEFPDFVRCFQELISLYPHQNVFQERLSKEFLEDLYYEYTKIEELTSITGTILLDENSVQNGVIDKREVSFASATKLVLLPQISTITHACKLKQSLSEMKKIVSLDIQDFHFDNLNTQQIVLLLPIFNQVKICKMFSCEFPHDPRVRSAILQSLQSLKLFEINGTLQHLSGQDWKDLFSSLPLLKVLMIEKTSLGECDSEQLQALMNVMPKLSGLELSMTNFETLSSSTLQRFFERCRGLRSLALNETDFFSLDASKVSAIFSHLSEVKSFDFSSCTFAHFDQLLKIISYCKSAENIEFAFSEISSIVEDWEKFFQSLPPNLKTLNLENNKLPMSFEFSQMIPEGLSVRV